MAGVEWCPLAFPSIALIEWTKFKDFLSILLSVTLGAGFIKCHQLFQKLLHFTSAFYSVELYVMINFSLRHNVLCFSFVVALYSMYSLYAIINPISTGLFCLVVALGGGGGVFHPPFITPLSLKLDCSNFVWRYFQIG